MKRRILMVDDEPGYVEMIKMRLEANNYEVMTAFNGEDGLKIARDERPNLILLDVMMPGLDGFQVLRRLRDDEKTRHTPIIMLTAKGETKSIFKSDELGATDHLIKPCESDELLDAISRHILP